MSRRGVLIGLAVAVHVGCVPKRQQPSVSSSAAPPEGRTTTSPNAHPTTAAQDTEPCSPVHLTERLPVAHGKTWTVGGRAYAVNIEFAEIPDINGDGAADFVVEDRTNAPDYQPTAFKLVLGASKPPCLVEVLHVPYGQFKGVDAEISSAGWRKIWFTAYTERDNGEFAQVTYLSANDGSGYKIDGGDPKACKVGTSEISLEACQNQLDSVVCSERGTNDKSACLRLCRRNPASRCQGLCEDGLDAACGVLAEAKASARAECLQGDFNGCQSSCRYDDFDSCERWCKIGNPDGCLALSVHDQKKCDSLCAGGLEAACKHASYDAREIYREKARKQTIAGTRAALPGLFKQCEANRAVVYRWKKQWIEAKRQGNWESAEQAELELTNFNPQWSATLSEIREAISTITDDQGDEFRGLMDSVEQRCSLPASAGF